MRETDDSDPDETLNETKSIKALVVRMDAEHWQALEELAKRERMSKQNALRHLIRVTHALAFEEKSPFTSLEGLIRRKVG